LLNYSPAQRTLFQSIIQCKCPRCRKGNLFVAIGHFNYAKMLAMPQKCSVCAQEFEIEPGFYLAALWISYPIVLVMELAILAGCYLFFNYSLLFSFIVAALFLIVVMPPIMRYSRSILIHLFVSFDETKVV